MPHLVRKVELVWLVDSFEPATIADFKEFLPIQHNSIYVRLRHLHRSGYLDVRTEGRGTREGYEWSVTEGGRQWLAAQNMPDVESVDLDEYFAGRADSINPLSILEEFALEDGEWQKADSVYDALPFTKNGIRKVLHNLNEQGDLEVNKRGNGYAYRWRLTEQGRERLTTADESERDDSGEYVWID